MQKKYLKASVEPEAANRFERIADRYGMTGAALAGILVHEFSHVRPEALFEALGAIPNELKARPVGRPPGSTKSQDKAHSAA